MATEKRERQRAARQAKEQAGTSEAKRSRRFSTLLRVGGIIVAALVAAFAYSVIWGGNGDDDDTDSANDTEDTAADADDAGTAFSELSISDDCPPDDGSGERQEQFDGAPPWCIDISQTYVAEVATSAGSFEITLDADAAPVATNNFVFLANSQYYDGAQFHRVIPGFVAQTGDPVGDPVGTGDPGYTLGDDPRFTGELPQGEPHYPEMSVAMANSGGDPFSAGSQFFVVVGEEGEALDPDYTRLGEVTSGEDVVASIEETGEGLDDPNDVPADPVTIESVTITAS